MEKTTPTDNDLATRAGEGDLEAFETLIHRYEKAIVRMIWQYTQDIHLAEDLAQETFVKAFRHLGRFDSKRAGFSTWLYTIARNLCHSAHRKIRSFPGDSLSERELSTTNSPDENAERREEFRRLDAAVNELGNGVRERFPVLTPRDPPRILPNAPPSPHRV